MTVSLLQLVAQEMKIICSMEILKLVILKV